MPGELHRAAADPNGLENVRSLIANGADIHEENSDGLLPIDIATSLDHFDTIAFLFSILYKELIVKFHLKFIKFRTNETFDNLILYTSRAIHYRINLTALTDEDYRFIADCYHVQAILYHQVGKHLLGRAAYQHALTKLGLIQNKNEEDKDKIEQFTMRVNTLHKTHVEGVEFPSPDRLHWAAADPNGFAKVVELVETAHVNPNQNHTETHHSPVYYATLNGNELTLDYLIRTRQVNLDASRKSINLLDNACLNSIVVRNYVTDPERKLHLQFNDGTTALMMAASRGDAAQILNELSKMTDMLITNIRGHSALYYAALEGHVDVVRSIISQPLFIESHAAIVYQHIHEAVKVRIAEHKLQFKLNSPIIEQLDSIETTCSLMALIPENHRNIFNDTLLALAALKPSVAASSVLANDAKKVRPIGVDMYARDPSERHIVDRAATSTSNNGVRPR